MTDEAQTAVGEAVSRLTKRLRTADPTKLSPHEIRSWFNWAADALSSISERERGLVEAAREAEDFLSATFGPMLEYEEGGVAARWSDDDAKDVWTKLRSALQSMKGE